MKFNNTKIDYSKEVHIKINNEEDYKYFLEFLLNKYKKLHAWYIPGRERYEANYKHVMIDLEGNDLYRIGTPYNDQIFDVKELNKLTSLFKDFENKL